MDHIDRFPEGPGRWRTDRLGWLPCVRPGCVVRDCRLGAWTELMEDCRFERVDFGAYSYAAGDVDAADADIGRFVSIARGVRINAPDHPMERATQHHCTYRRELYGLGADDTSFFRARRAQRVSIGHDVWIGHRAIILPGVRVGIGAAIGAGAVVTQDVPDYAVVAGVPARTIRMRLEPELIPAMLAIGWWDWDRATLEARFADLAGDLRAFVARYQVTA